MKRGLKCASAYPGSLSSTLEGTSPMKRGLKSQIGRRYGFGVTVEGTSPMKRGLKFHDHFRKQQLPRLKGLPR